MQKLFCYVDETGQDPRSDFFLVSVIVVEENREALIQLLEGIERVSGKGRRKWMAARSEQRIIYIQHVLSLHDLKGRLIYAVYPGATDYLPKTVLTTARAITVHAKTEYKATIFIDGLPRSLIRKVGPQLRVLEIRTEKVRGVRDEESDALIRLADAICGFVRSARTGKSDFSKLLARAQAEGFIKEV
jgi:hypothetical protein